MLNVQFSIECTLYIRSIGNGALMDLTERKTETHCSRSVIFGLFPVQFALQLLWEMSEKFDYVETIFWILLHERLTSITIQ